MKPSEPGAPRPDLRATQAEARRLGEQLVEQRRLSFEGLAGCARSLVRIKRFSRAMDDLLVRCFEERAPALQRAGAVLVALGGYGRRELYPFSDVDLMVLLPTAAPPELEEETSRLLQLLWDARFPVSHAVRTVQEAVEILHADEVSATALLEARPLAGARSLWDRFAKEHIPAFLDQHRRRYLHGRLRQLRSRRDFYGGSGSHKEPNLKEAPGGLRDLQEARWVARALRGVEGAEDRLRPHEPRALIEAWDWVARLRALLHLQANRKQDHLSLEQQQELAPLLGFADAERLASEALMQRTLRAMRRLEEAAWMAEEEVQRWLERSRRPKRKLLEAPFVAVEGRLYVQNEKALDQAPAGARCLRAFALAQRLHLRVSMQLGQAISRRVAALDPAFREDPEVGRWFREIFQGRENVADTLTDMHRFGLLGAYLPEYEGIDALVLSDPYHRWSVDMHLLQSVREADRLEHPDGVDPRRDILLSLSRPDLLKFALFVHDIGKARRGGHVERAMELLPDMLERIGMPSVDANHVGWLVREHLTLMHAQRRENLADPAVQDRLCARLETVERLRSLYLLTVCDSRATSATALPAWLDALFHETFCKLEKRLSRTPGGPPERSLRDELRDEPEACRHLEGLPRRYRFDRQVAEVRRHVALLREVQEGEVLAMTPVARQEAVEVWFAARDRPGLFADLAAVLTANQFAIVAADLFTRDDGLALDRFLAVSLSRDDALDARRWKRLRRDFLSLHEKGGGAPQLVERRAGFLDHGPSPGRISVRLEERLSSESLVVEVEAPDFPGLLFRVAEAFSTARTPVVMARIATIGERASDRFYLERTAPPQGAALTEDGLRELLLQALQPGTHEH